MLKLWKKTERQLWYNVCNWRFLLAVLSCVVVCMLPTVSVMEGYSFRRESILQLFLTGGFEENALDNFELCSLTIVGNVINSDWFMLLMLLLCSFPAISMFSEEYNSGMFYFTVTGLSVREYSVVKYVAAALSGGIVFLCGYAIYAVLIFMRFPGISEYPADVVQNYQMLYGSMNGGYFIKMLFHLSVVSMLCAAVVSAVSVFIRDKYFLFGLPMLGEFFVGRLHLYAAGRHWGIYDEGHGWWSLAVADTYPRFFQDFKWKTGLPYGCFLVIALLWLIAFYSVFYTRIRRRIKKHV